MNTCLYANEIDDYACAVYNRHWPDGTLHQEDIRNVTADDVCRRGVPDLICGGFPCQDLSYAGKGAGLSGERSGLYRELLRLVRQVRPSYVVVENVTGLLTRGLGVLLADLAALGFDAEWQVLPACAFGAPHERSRVFLVAYSEKIGCKTVFKQYRLLSAQDCTEVRFTSGGCVTEPRMHPVRHVWQTEPDMVRVADGVPERVDRIGCLGNSIVPQVAQFVGECIMAHNGGEFTFAELFAGIGGFRLGFEWASGREVAA